MESQRLLGNACLRHVDMTQDDDLSRRDKYKTILPFCKHSCHLKACEYGHVWTVFPFILLISCNVYQCSSISRFGIAKEV